MSPLKPEPVDTFLGSMFDDFFPGLDDWGHQVNKAASCSELNNHSEEPVLLPTKHPAVETANPIKADCEGPAAPKSDTMPTGDNTRRSDKEHAAVPKSSVLPSEKGASAVQSQLSVRCTRKEVIRLEKEISEKLSLLTLLEQKNKQLKRKEKLLKVGNNGAQLFAFLLLSDAYLICFELDTAAPVDVSRDR